MTPDYSFDPLDPSKNNGRPYYPSFPRSNGSTYPAMPQSQDPSGLPYYQPANQRMTDIQMEDPYPSLEQAALQPIPPQSQYHTPTDPALSIPTATSLPPQVAPVPSKPPPTTPSSTKATTTPDQPSSSSASKAVKKKYPCPHAARYSCTDTFTTSGHAARHGKKHTGEKNIHCPTCNKAFTRKDNMKQHERTHKTSRAENPSPATPATSKPSSVSSRPRRPAPVSAGSNSPVAAIIDGPGMEFDGDSSKLDLSGQLRLPDPTQDVRPASNGRIPSVSGRSEVDGEGDSPGLDALAHVASEMVG